MDWALILLLTSILVTILALSVLLFVLITNKHHKEYLESAKKQILLSPDRERMENEIYGMVDVMTSSPLRFQQANHLFLSPSYKKMKLSEEAVSDTFFAEVGVSLDTIKVEKDFVMCLMPFHKNYNLLRDAIKRACSKSMFVFHRSDEKFVSAGILKYTVEQILSSQIVIAVLDGRNANVFYEIGIAHAIGKPVLLLANRQKLGELPFDIQSNRIILYSSYSDLENQLTNVLMLYRNNDSRE